MIARGYAKAEVGFIHWRPGVRGLQTATAWNINNNVNALAAGGYFIQGDYAEGTQQFTVNLDTGADTLYINTNGGTLSTAANNGSASIIFTGAVLVAGDFN